jgi:hypothetical protein
VFHLKVDEMSECHFQIKRFGNFHTNLFKLRVPVFNTKINDDFALNDKIYNFRLKFGSESRLVFFIFKL